MGHGEAFLKSPTGPSHEAVLRTDAKGVMDETRKGIPVYSMCKKGLQKNKQTNTPLISASNTVQVNEKLFVVVTALKN